MSFDPSDDRRDALHRFMQDAGPNTGEPALLTGWVIVQEWAGRDGKFLSKGFAAETSAWCADGMLHEALYGEWDEGDDDDGDDG